jgi:hypothetical protein
MNQPSTIFPSDLVAFRDDFLDHVQAVGERAAQERAGPREALALDVRRQVVEAAAQTLVAGRQHFLHRGFFFRRALRFLEAQRHRLVALEQRRLRLGGPHLMPRQRQSRSRQRRALEKPASRKHSPPFFTRTHANPRWRRKPG